MKAVLASHNKKKLAELKAIFAEKLPQIQLLSLSDIGFDGEIEENGSSFEENSIIKASVPASLGYIGIADDSGLCVDFLGGAPGIYSARYSGGGDGDNIDKLLSALDGVPKEKRTARFVCVMSAVFPDGRVITSRGEAEGLILSSRHGSGGFGYDPVFYSLEARAPFGTLPPERKNEISHRAKAINGLAVKLSTVIKEY